MERCKPHSEARLCSMVSRAAGDSPGGSATPFDTCLMVEVALPWHDDVADSWAFPDRLWEAVLGAWERGIIGKFTVIAPDSEYSRKGYSRVLYFRRPRGLFAYYEKDEFLVPDAQLIPALEALFAGPEALSRFERYRQDTPRVRDVMVCTHGAHDPCCGKFGYPIYAALREEFAGEGLRVWRTSHIGGHRFAPTLLDFPEGRYWGHLDRGALEPLILRNAPPSRVGRLHRGWAGAGTRFEQLAESEILMREGWRWTEYPKRGRLLRVDGDRNAAEVRIDFVEPGGRTGAYTAAIECSGSVMTLPDSGCEPLQEARQYRVSRLQRET